MAVRFPSLIREGARAFGRQCIVLSMQVKRVAKSSRIPSGYEIMIDGARVATGLDAVEWARQGEELGAGEICVNSIDQDGTHAGYDLEIMALISNKVNVPVIASGGAGHPGHVAEVFQKAGASAAITSSMLYSPLMLRNYSIREIKGFLLLIVAAPLNEKEIPVYPGAVRDQAAEEDLRWDYEKYSYDHWELKSIRVYKVKALIDDVCRYYIDQLKAKPGRPIHDPYDLSPGEVDEPWYEVGFWHETIFETQYEYDTLLNDGEWVKEAFAKRPQWEKGSWLNGAWFEWNTCLPGGDVARYVVLLEDEGFDSRKRVDYRSTRIRIEVHVSPSLEAIEEEEDWLMDQAFAAKAEQFRKNPPTEQSLGVPLYPGAVFSPELTAGMSLNDDFHIYVYFSNDPLDQIADFYRKRLGEEPEFIEGFGYLFALKGSLPLPEEGLSIQPYVYGDGPFQSTIAIQKKVGK